MQHRYAYYVVVGVLFLGLVLFVGVKVLKSSPDPALRVKNVEPMMGFGDSSHIGSFTLPDGGEVDCFVRDSGITAEARYPKGIEPMFGSQTGKYAVRWHLQYATSTWGDGDLSSELSNGTKIFVFKDPKFDRRTLEAYIRISNSSPARRLASNN